MTGRTVHVHIRRLVIDASVEDARAIARDPRALSALIAARIAAPGPTETSRVATWQSSVAEAVAAAVPSPHAGGTR